MAGGKSKVQSFRDLVAWKKAMDLVAEIYRATAGFPREEVFGLTSQARRAAVSVPSNIAEGQGRQSTKEVRHHLSISYGSLCELETQLLIARQLGYLQDEPSYRLLQQAAEVGRVINGLMNSLQSPDPLTTDH